MNVPSKLFVGILPLLLLASCSQDETENGETLFRGSARVACDREIAPLIVPQITSFLARHEKAHVQLDTLVAAHAMAALFAGNVRAAFIARDYTFEEDSLLRAYKLEPHKRLLIATDALVFVVANRSPLDTLDHNELLRLLRGEKSSLSKYRIAAPEFSSSITAYLRSIAGNAHFALRAKYVGSGDSVLNRVLNGTADIGIALLSQLLAHKEKSRLRPLRIIVRDTETGDRIAIAPHAATIVKERYPFRVPLYGYLLETARNFAYGVVAHIAHEPEPQRAMLRAGIVPAYARIQLVEQE